MTAVIDLIKPLVFEPRVAALTALLMLAALIDIRQHRIPNWLVIVGICIAVAYNGLHAPSMQANSWLLVLEGTLVGFFMLLPFYIGRAMGAGDVKLMAMVGAFLGPVGAFWSVLATFIAGGVLAIMILAWHRRVGRAVRNVYALITVNMLTASAGSLDFSMSGTDSAGKLPYAVAIAFGTAGYLILHSGGYVS